VGGERVLSAGRVAVGVSGAGSNLKALVAAARRGSVRGEVVLVFADRPCPAVEWAAEEGVETAMLPGLASPEPGERAAADEALAATLRSAAIDVVALAGYMRIVGPATLGAFVGRIVNTHPSLLPSFPGAHAVRDALAHGVTVTGCTVHLVDDTLDGGPILLQEAVPVLVGDDEVSLHLRIKAVEHRLLPRAVGLLLAGAFGSASGGRPFLDSRRADGAMPLPRRALLSVSDKTGLVELGTGLVALGFELVSTGGTARALRDAGLPVTDVSAVTGFPEMLDGRVKTLHPAVHAGILADRRRAEHREALIGAGVAAFEVVVVNLYPFAAAAERPGITLDALVEEIDIGGPSLVRAAAKNHASVAIVTTPDRYDQVLEALAAGEVPLGLRSALAVEAFRQTAAYDARIASELPCAMDRAGVALPPEPGLPRSPDRYPDILVVPLAKVETLRYGENPHQPAARYRRTDRPASVEDGPFAGGEAAVQGKALSYNNVLDASAAAALARLLRGPACVVVKHTNPCGAAERATLLDAWEAARAGDPDAAFGGVVALTATVDADVARALTTMFLEVVVAPGFEPAALEVLATKPNLRVVADPGITLGPRGAIRSNGTYRVDDLGSIRSAGGAVLVTAPDDSTDDPAEWALLSRREPSGAERADLDLAWRLCRGVTSNAIVLVRDGMLVGLGSGQVSRVDACRQAVAKAERFHAETGGARGAVAASDAFFPFPDGPGVLLEAGVSAIVQPGGSLRDGEVLHAVDEAGAAMLVTGKRHFRH
jgi:phosphoribosylaminoimidazolecarboxamide formyltransferase / IMP cyclohydrolase